MRFLKSLGQSLLKLGKIGAVAVGSTAIANGPETVQVLSQTDPKTAMIFSAIYMLIDAYRHRNDVK